VSDREFRRQMIAMMAAIDHIIASAAARLDRLRAAKRGDLVVKRVNVKTHRVPAHNVVAHERIIMTKKKAA